jgi:SAM-dependent methyltransferase
MARKVSQLFPGRQSGNRDIPTSAEYVLIEPALGLPAGLDGWRDPAVAERQDSAFQGVLQEMYAGRPREDLLAAAEALRRSGRVDGSLLEVGSGSGYYSEILSYLLQRPIRYVGLDYSHAMVELARRRYPSQRFLVGDAAALPFANGAFDVVLNGVSLMHTVRYGAAIAESRRVTRRWCIFHTVPVLQCRRTTLLRKRAYGQPTIEIIFNEGELAALLQRSGLEIRHVAASVPYDLKAVVGEPTLTRTYLCEIAECPRG